MWSSVVVGTQDLCVCVCFSRVPSVCGDILTWSWLELNIQYVWVRFSKITFSMLALSFSISTGLLEGQQIFEEGQITIQNLFSLAIDRHFQCLHELLPNVKVHSNYCYHKSILISISLWMWFKAFTLLVHWQVSEALQIVPIWST